MPVLGDKPFSLYDTSGNPLSGLSPTWLDVGAGAGNCIDLTTLAAVTPPTVTGRRGGRYVVQRLPTNGPHVCGWADFGAACHPQCRWQWYDGGGPDGFCALFLRNADFSPLTDAGSGTWLCCADDVTDIAVTPPTIAEIEGGLYRAANVAAAGQQVSGLVNFGAGLEPIQEYHASRPVAAQSIASEAYYPPASAQVTAATDYGTDFSTFPDLNFRPIVQQEALGEAVTRMLSDARAGVDLREWLNNDVSGSDAYDMAQTIQAQCVTDERIAGARATITQPDRLSLLVSLALTPADGVTPPFSLVLSISALSVSLLSIGPTP